MGRALILLYGVASYLLFGVVYLYLVGFLWGVVVPRGINDGEVRDVGASLAIDLVLVTLFGLTHSVMARPAFKAMWTRIIAPAAERSTYVLVSSLCLVALFAGWQPLPAALWDLRGTPWSELFFGVSALGWALVVISTFMIDHLALFGLKQVAYNFLGSEVPPARFVVRGPYRFTRHPLMLGFVVAFWATPWMTVGHLLFAASMTAYILVALRYEERDLRAVHGEDYARYTGRTSRLVPFGRR